MSIPTNENHLYLSIYFVSENKIKNISIDPQSNIQTLYHQVKKQLDCCHFQLTYEGRSLKKTDESTLNNWTIKENACLELTYKEKKEVSSIEGSSHLETRRKSFSFIKFMKPVEQKISDNAQPWQKTAQGLNLIGICPNLSCAAQNQEVYIPIQDRICDVGYVKHKAKCPISECGTKIKNIIGCLFQDCDYQVDGILKNTTPHSIHLQSVPKGYLHRFSQNDNQQNTNVEWSSLTITCRNHFSNRQKILMSIFCALFFGGGAYFMLNNKKAERKEND